MIHTARLATVLSLLGLTLGSCATTTGASRVITASIPTRPASAEDCAVISITLELFSRPSDGSPLRVSDTAVSIQPPFRPQRPEQRGVEALSLSGCRAIQTEFVSENPRVVLNRPEVHDDSVFVRYREGAYAPVWAELDRTPEGHWRHIGAYPTSN